MFQIPHLYNKNNSSAFSKGILVGLNESTKFLKQFWVYGEFCMLAIIIIILS